MRKLIALVGAALVAGCLTLSATAASAQDTVPVAPGKPVQVAAGRNTATIFWRASPGATGYHVFVDGRQVATASTNMFTLTGLREASRFRVTVTAFNAAGESAQSPDGLILTLPFSDPPPPRT